MNGTNEHPEQDSHRTPPTDVAEELERLRRDVSERGVDVDAAVELARVLSHTMPEAEALRTVDRRIASGLTLEQTRQVLVDEG